MNVEMLDTPVKPRNQVVGLEEGLNLQEYVYQNLNMFSGKAEKVEFEIPHSAVSLVIDFFGKHVSFTEMENGMVSSDHSGNGRFADRPACRYFIWSLCIQPELPGEFSDGGGEGDGVLLAVDLVGGSDGRFDGFVCGHQIYGRCKSRIQGFDMSFLSFPGDISDRSFCHGFVGESKRVHSCFQRSPEV